MSRRIWIPRGLVSPSKATGVDRSPSRTLEGGPRVLELYQESVPGNPGVSLHTSREFPTGCSWVHQFPRRQQKRSWRPGFTPDTGVEVVLGAWCYTRAGGTEVIHVAATGFQGIPDCIARYNFPRIWRRLLNTNGC